MTKISAPWVIAAASRAVMDALGEGFFVGGCVRNALLGAPVTDIDVATPLLPDDVRQRLEAAGLKAIPTGVAHGTVTAVHNGTPIEITTFRADVETFGRHATVSYTTEMAVDASRRDFTMNALYADREGEVIDPLGGMADLMVRRIRFIGDPHDRIREDYLRILRFFRFHAWYGADGLDADGLAACAELAEGVEDLARERIGWEFRKLLSAPDPAPCTASMATAGVLMRCLPGADPAALAPLVHVEEISGESPNWITRLAAIGGENPVQNLRLSRAEAQRLERLRGAIESDTAPAVMGYRFGGEIAFAASLVMHASVGTEPPAGLRAEIARGASQQFPLTAGDLIAAGMSPGPELGVTLARAEAAWIESGFSHSKDELMRYAAPPSDAAT